MAEFAYNNAKNISTDHITFKLNCSYHSYIPYEKNIDLCSWSETAEKLLVELPKLMSICHDNLYHAPELQKQPHNRNTKLKRYALSNEA